MAQAVGCVGMSLDDFCRCTPSEFYAVWHAWHETWQWQDRSQWERTRTECLCMLQPYSRQKLTAQDVMAFSWDTEESEADSVKSEPSAALTREEEMVRYRAAKAKWGLK